MRVVVPHVMLTSYSFLLMHLRILCNCPAFFSKDWSFVFIILQTPLQKTGVV